MKKMGKLFFTLILFILLIGNAKAEVYFNVTKAANGTGAKCPQNSLYLRLVGSDSSTKQTINFYNVYESPTSRIAYGQTFCMAPGKESYRNNGEHYCERVITPQKAGANQAFDVAATYAYQTMVNEGIIGANPTIRSRVVGTMTFRWLEYYFGKLDMYGTTSQVTPYIFRSNLDNRTNAVYWNQSNSYVKKAIEISSAAKQLGVRILNGKTTYEKLVAKGKIWTDEWNFVLVNTKQEGDYVTIKFDVTPKAGKAPKSVRWKQFDITCEYGYTCEVVKRKKISDNTGRYVVKINTKNGNANKSGDQTYGMRITTAYADQRNPSAYMMLLTPKVGTQYHQKMLLVKDYVNSYFIQTEIPVKIPETKCLCEEVDGKFTGDYVYYTTDENGNTTSEVIPKDDERIPTLDCPAVCENPEKPSCEIETDGGQNTYYCKDGEECDQETYHKECLHVCETPDQNDEHKYYCTEKVPDQGGEECNETQYLDECYCPPLKEKCEEDPNDPACDEYEEKCPNCNASVSVPGTCSDFDTNSTVVGTISDVNQQKSECNDSVNPVKRCVIDSVDQTNTSYEATNEIANNKYCKVWCDESYQFDMPTARYSLSGGYFNLSTKISGTRNCYISSASNPDKPIDVEGFEKELSDLNRDLYVSWNEWNKWNTLYERADIKALADDDTKEQNLEWEYTSYDYNNNASTVKVSAIISKSGIIGFKDKFFNEYQEINKQITDATNAFNACTITWKNTMNFDPEISFTYHEEEYNKIGNGKFKRVSDVSTDVVDTYCLGDTDNQYNCLSGKIVANQESVPDNVFKNTTVVTCNNNGCSANNTFKLSKAKWIQKTKTKSATYSPSQNFSTYHQYGTIVSGDPCKNANVDGYTNCLWTRLPDTALPVELKTGKGAFPFNLKFSNIGQSNQDNSVGRLVGNNTSVLTEYNKLPDNKKCSVNGNENGVLTQEAGYVCAYVNNCPECDVSCDGDNCYIKEQCDGECPVSCKNCIFNGTSTAFKYRTISLNDLFPNSCDSNTANCRKEGYNWNYTGSANRAVNQKAAKTVKEIEDQGEDVYDNAEYSYTLSPTQMGAIKQYNRTVGTYANTTLPNGENALQCDIETYGGIEYSVRCKSQFLRSNEGLYFNTNKRNDTFTLWTETDNCRNGSCLSISNAIGPSWK